MSLVALLFAVAAAAQVNLAGDSTCPTPAAVTSRLGAISPEATTGGGAPNRVTLTRDLARNDAGLHLVLTDPSGAVLATKTLAAAGSCDDLAAAAAVVIATWQADLNPDLTPRVNLPATREPAAPPPSIAVVAAPEAPANRPIPFAVGLGLMTSDAGGAFAPGATLQGWVGLGTHGLGVGASLAGTTSRSAAVGGLPDAASWTRTTLGVGPMVLLGPSSVRLEAHAQALAAAVHVRGVGVPNATADTTFQAGAALGGKVVGLTGTSLVWLGVDVLAWPGDQRLLIENLSGEGKLPTVEVTASLGVGLGRFP